MLEFTTAFQHAVLTDTSQHANCCWEIKHTHANCPHERSSQTWSASSAGQDGKLGKPRSCSRQNTRQNTHFLQHWSIKPEPCLQASPLKAGAGKRSTDLKAHPATCNREKETVPVIHASLSDVTPQLRCLPMKASEDPASLQLLG